MVKEDLQKAYTALAKISLDAHSYKGEIADIVFEIITAETFIMGIASKLFESASLPPEEVFILRKEYLRGSDWVRENGRHFSLNFYPELLSYVKDIENHCCPVNSLSHRERVGVRGS